MIRVSIAEMKRRFFELIDQVQSGETVIILRQGRAVAKLIPSDRKKRWRVEAPDDPKYYTGINLNEPILGEI
jgi:prevent-host-death family protein